MSKISIAIPIYDMKNGDFFLNRCIASIYKQTFRDFELVITKEGRMAENTNAAIKKSKGELIKILYMDDYLAHEDSLQKIVDAFSKGDNWLATGCEHDDLKSRGNPHYPSYDHEMYKGKNTIGSPSVITIRNDNPLLFDEQMTWVLDCDYYVRMYEKFGEPKLLYDINVVMGIGEHQTTNALSEEIKRKEVEYMLHKS